MSDLEFEGMEIPLASGQTVLDAIHAAGEWLSYGCRSGNCQTCLVRAVDGIVPQGAQEGLNAGLAETGHFLACQARPTSSLSCVRPDHVGLERKSRVISLQHATQDILRLRFEKPDDFDYRAGQYVSIWRDDTVGRAYSLVSVPGEDEWLECYVRILRDGYMSHWFATELQRGDAISFRGPAGDCFYQAMTPETPLLLAGSGVGMAPLTGVLRDALRKRHTGPIAVYHGVRDEVDLVFDEFLRRVSEEFPQVEYVPCVGRGDDGAPMIESRLFANYNEFKGWQVMLCGAPGIVSRIRQRVFLSGAASRDIHADEFVSRPGVAAD